MEHATDEHDPETCAVCQRPMTDKQRAAVEASIADTRPLMTLEEYETQRGRRQ